VLEDYIIRAMAAEGSIRAFVATTRQMVQTAREIHDTSPVVSAALGRTMTAAAMMGLMLKGEDDLITIQIKGDGPMKGVVVTADHKANVKGYVHQPHVELPLNQKGKLDVGGCIGSGMLSIIKDMGLKKPYIGQVPLVTGEIAEDLTYYFFHSEQTPSAVSLGVLVDRDTSIKQSGGFIIQLMPNAEEHIIEKLEKQLAIIPSITEMMDEGNTPEQILEKVLDGLNPYILDKVPTQFYCNCSRGRVEKALISIGIKDLQEIVEEEKKATLHCHFCNKEFLFKEQELRDMIERLTE
jgi:molecular chaperone Hsp33